MTTGAPCPLSSAEGGENTTIMSGVMNTDEFLFQWYALSFCVNPHNFPNCTNWSHLQKLFLSRSIWSMGRFGGNNDRFCIYPLSDCYWGVIKKCLNIYRHIFVPNWVNQENQ